MCFRFPFLFSQLRSTDGTSQSDNGDERSNTGITANIRPVPVLFTDTFRWMLKAGNGVTTSARTLFMGPENSHWSLPEATVIREDQLPLDDKVMNGTYVLDLGPEEIVKTRGPGCSRSIERSLRPSRQALSICVSIMQEKETCPIMMIHWKEKLPTSPILAKEHWRVSREVPSLRLGNKALIAKWILWEACPNVGNCRECQKMSLWRTHLPQIIQVTLLHWTFDPQHL